MEQNDGFQNLLIRQPVLNCADAALNIFIYVCCKLSSRSIFTNQIHINDLMIETGFHPRLHRFHTFVLGTNWSPAWILVLVGPHGPPASRILMNQKFKKPKTNICTIIDMPPAWTSDVTCDAKFQFQYNFQTQIMTPNFPFRCENLNTTP